MWYNIDFQKLSVSLLPTMLRKAKFIAYTKVLVSPLVTMHYKFLRNRKNDSFLLNHTSQICYFKKALNDKFDSTLRRIKIKDSTDIREDFIVYDVPSDISAVKLYEIKATINFFKKATKRYKIVRI